MHLSKLISTSVPPLNPSSPTTAANITAQRGRCLLRRINFVNTQLYVDMIVSPGIKIKKLFVIVDEK